MAIVVSVTQLVQSTAQLPQVRPGQTIKISGTVSQLRLRATKMGRPVVSFTLKDYAGEVAVLVFPDAYVKCAPALQENAMVTVSGGLRLTNDKPIIYAEEIVPNP